MFGFGPWEMAIIGVVVLLVLGPAFLPKLGRHLGSSLLGLRQAARSFSETVKEEMEEPNEDDKKTPPALAATNEETKHSKAG